MNPWELIVQQPVINVLIVIAHFLGDSFGWAIIALTIIVNLALLPLSLSQLRSTKAMQELQPRLAELQMKYAKDKQRLAQEQMRLYKESGVKPAGCALTMVIQFPVWIALYQSIMLTLAIAPEGLLNLSKYLYPWPVVFDALPMSQQFLGLNLGEPNVILAILVGATMWVSQRMSTVASSDPRQQQQAQMMLWMMPLMFTFLATTFPSGLSLYWVASSIVRIAMQYRISGAGGLVRGSEDSGDDKERKRLTFAPTPDEPSSGEVKSITPKKEDVIYPEKPSKNRYQPGKDRSGRRKRT